MSRSPVIARTMRFVTIVLAVLCGVAVTSLSGQQAQGVTVAQAAPAEGVSAHSGGVPAPHASSLFQRDDASSKDAAPAVEPSGGDTHTIRLTTLALVLVVVIAVLLIVR